MLGSPDRSSHRIAFALAATSALAFSCASSTGGVPAPQPPQPMAAEETTTSTTERPCDLPFGRDECAPGEICRIETTNMGEPATVVCICDPAHANHLGGWRCQDLY